MSALFEKMIADVQGKTELEQLDEQTQAYYDALPDAAMREDYAWGSVGEAALADQAQVEQERRDDPQPRPAGPR